MKKIFCFLPVFLLFIGFASAQEALPLKLMPAAQGSEKPLIFIISGDGGWNPFIQSVSQCFVSKGYPVAGLDSRKYFWKAQLPDRAAQDINAAILRVMKQWGRKSYILAGYSFGACVAPFIASKAPAPQREQLAGLYGISPDEKGDFEIHISDMLSLGTAQGKYDVVAEYRKLRALQPVCLFGSQESTATRRSFSGAGIKMITLPGNHHYNNNYCAIAGAIIKNEEVR